MLDDTLHSPARLQICAYLSGCAEAEFAAVASYCGLSASALSKQVTVLSDAGHIGIRKVAAGRYTRTRLHLTGSGRAALDAHVTSLQELVAAARTEGAVTRIAEDVSSDPYSDDATQATPTTVRP